MRHLTQGEQFKSIGSGNRASHIANVKNQEFPKGNSESSGTEQGAAESKSAGGAVELSSLLEDDSGECPFSCVKNSSPLLLALSL